MSGILASWMSCADVGNSSRALTLSLEGRVEFTCLDVVVRLTFAPAVEHGSVDPKCQERSIMEKGFM